MPRLATTFDVFNAIAEPQRRAILNLLALNERPVNELAEALDIAQPRVSKHLAVLRAVDLVTVRGEGAQRIYRASAAGLKPVHDWVKSFEDHWNERFDRLDAHLRARRRADKPPRKRNR